VNAILRAEFVKVDEEANRCVQKLHIAEELCLVNRENCLYRLQFHQETIVDVEIKCQRFGKDQAFVFDPHVKLA
jgi:hypothetical protein